TLPRVGSEASVCRSVDRAKAVPRPAKPGGTLAVRPRPETGSRVGFLVSALDQRADREGLRDAARAARVGTRVRALVEEPALVPLDGRMGHVGGVLELHVEHQEAGIEVLL